MGRSAAVTGLLLSLLALMIVAGHGQVAAQESNRAAIVVRFDDDDRAAAFERYLKSGSGHAFANKRLW